MCKCLVCGREDSVEELSFKDEAIRSIKEFMPQNLYGLKMIGKAVSFSFSQLYRAFKDDDSYDMYVTGSILKCKYCGAYHFQCDGCFEISLLAYIPGRFTKVKCPYCSKNVILDWDDSEGFNPH